MYVVCLIWDSGSLAVLHSYMEVPAVFSIAAAHDDINQEPIPSYTQ